MSRYVNTIVNSLKAQQCVILLGPEAALTDKGVSLQQDLKRYLKEETTLQIDFDIENLVVFKDKLSEMDFFPELEKYYEAHKTPGSLHLLLSEIPAHVFISITPDVKLRQAFEEKDLPHTFQVYNKDASPQDIDKPEKDKPVVFNLFGCIEEENSMINTTNDLFEFLFSLLSGEKRLPRNLESALKSTRLFVFLGFNFDKWYMKLILRLFHLHEEPMPLVSGNGTNMDDNAKNFFINNFEMQFIGTEISDFVTELHTELGSQGLLREASSTTQSPDSAPSLEDEGKSDSDATSLSVPAQIKELIENNEIEQVIELAKDFLEAIDRTDENEDTIEEFETMLILQSRTFKDLKKKQDQDIFSNEDKVEWNKVIVGLISLANEMEKKLINPSESE